MKSKLSLSLLGLFMVGAASVSAASPVVLADESLTYDVVYKWGLINKVAGHATMSLRSENNRYHASVYARNASWANKIYMLRDTLYSTMTKGDFYPISYTYIAHEKGKYKKDVLNFHRNGNTFSAEATRYKQKNSDSPMTVSSINLEADGMTVDMLSSFFYLRSLDFENMTVGESVTVNIFSGTKKEMLKITYKGRQNVKLDDQKYPAYYINFTFTRNGVESSEPISGWISTASQRIPLKVEGSLSVGKVRALYTGLKPQ